MVAVVSVVAAFPSVSVARMCKIITATTATIEEEEDRLGYQDPFQASLAPRAGAHSEREADSPGAPPCSLVP